MQNHQADSPLYVRPDVRSADLHLLIKSMVIHDTECPFWDQVSLNNTNQTKPNLSVGQYLSIGCASADVSRNYNNIFLLQCYYVGGLEESATGMLGEMSKPVSWGVPAGKVCMKLYKKDQQICDLKYGKYNLQNFPNLSVYQF